MNAWYPRLKNALLRRLPTPRDWADYLRSLCLPNSSRNVRLAVIVPYRDRAEHLELFLPYLSSYLTRWYDQVAIYVMEQAGSGPLNRGLLKNIGFALAKEHCDYFCFHDVDMLPEGVDYSFTPWGPVHLVAHASQFRYRLPFADYFGGAVMFSREYFQAVNGYPNDYWGWGLEDNNLRERCRRAGLKTIRRWQGRHRCLPHAPNPLHSDGSPNAEKFRRFLVTPGLPPDGLTTLSYRVLEESESGQLRKFKVEVSPPAG